MIKGAGAPGHRHAKWLPGVYAGLNATGSVQDLLFPNGSASTAEMSVIVVVKNAADTVERAINSVLDQTVCEIELIVVDGRSDDGTLEILRRRRDRIAKLISEPDQGIADAMNKGLAAAGGEWIYFLGADDRLANKHVVGRLLHAADECAADILAGTVLLETDSTTTSQRRLRPKGFNFRANFKTPLLHQGTICRRRLFSRIGAFDTSLGVAMDYDLFLRAYRNGERVCYVDDVVAVMSGCGVGSRADWQSVRRRLREERRVQLTYCRSTWLRLLYLGGFPLYLAYRWLRAV